MASSSSKRSPSPCNNNNQGSENPAKKVFWSLSLQQSMKDEKGRIFADEQMVIIEDRYPKARLHWLVLPWQNIETLAELGPRDVPLIRDMVAKAREVLESRGETKNYRIGFHAKPSMRHLHLHVISDDFDSPCLKTKKHWNTFTSPFFVDPEEIISRLEEEKSLTIFSEQKIKDLLAQPLKCHKCSKIFPNMPKLKAHLLVHFRDSSAT